MVRKVLNPYITHFERYKKEKLEKIKRMLVRPCSLHTFPKLRPKATGENRVSV
jgi:hypothetical protein